MKNRKSSKFKIHVAFVSVIILLLSGCQIIQSLSAIKSKKVKPHYYTYEAKSIIFVPLVHIGQKEFYASLKDSIIAWKNNNYTIFYKQVGSGQAYLGLDSISYDRLRRRFRRIDGGTTGTPEDYVEEAQKVFKEVIAQPIYSDLGIDSTDVHADINLLQLVEQYEITFGKITLDSCDYSTHLDSAYSCYKAVKMRKLDPIIVDYRNEVVIEKVIVSESEKIVILFGAAHRKGMGKLLMEIETTDD